jgi:hypothetical protein
MPQLRKKWRFSEEYPVRDEAPAHEHNLAFSGASVQADDRLERLRRNVVGRPEVGERWTMRMELLSNALLV